MLERCASESSSWAMRVSMGTNGMMMGVLSVVVVGVVVVVMVGVVVVEVVEDRTCA